MEGMTLEKLQVVIEAYTKPFRDELDKLQGKTKQATDAVTKHTNGMSSAFKKIGRTVGTVLGVAAIVSFGRSCLELGSDLQEVQNVVDVTFTSMNDSVNNFAKNAMTQFGLSETAAKKYVGMYGTMAKQFGFTERAAYDMSTGLAGMAGDVSSFYNMTSDEAYTKLKAVFSGETETLKDIGVVMTQNALDAYAMANGFGKTTQKMSEQEKVALRYQFVMQQLSGASGDFARTSGSWANQTRILALQFGSLKATIGQGLINMFTPVIRVINAVLARLQVLAGYFNQFTAAIFGKAASSGAGSSIAEVASDAGAASAAMGGLADSTKAASKASKGLSGFDEITNINAGSSDSGGSGGSGGGGAGGVGDLFGDSPGADASEEGINKFSGVVEKLKAILAPAAEALGRLKAAFEPFKQNVADGLTWLWNNVLVPFGGWAISTLVPAFFDLLSAALNVLNPLIDALEPLGVWLWESFLQPIAQWTGGVIVTVLDGISTALNSIGTWITENQKTVETLAIIIGSVAIALGLVNAAIAISNALVPIFTFITAAGGVAAAVSAVATTALGAAVAFLTSPITLVVAAIAALIAIIVLLVRNWDTVKAVAARVWKGIVETFSGIGLWFAEKFGQAWGAITNAFSNIGSFFGGLWDTIVAKFTAVGTSIGNAVGGAFKSAVNGIFSTIESIVNGFIKTINGAITLINKIPGVSIGKISTVSLPRLATGGIVDRPTVAMIGEAGSEAVVPLKNNTSWADAIANVLFSRLGGGGMSNSGSNRPLEITLVVDRTKLGKVCINSINELQMREGAIVL